MVRIWDLLSTTYEIPIKHDYSHSNDHCYDINPIKFPYHLVNSHQILTFLVLFGHPFREPFTAAAAGRYWQDGRPTASVDFDPLSDLPAAAKAPDGIPRD